MMVKGQILFLVLWDFFIAFSFFLCFAFYFPQTLPLKNDTSPILCFLQPTHFLLDVHIDIKRKLIIFDSVNVTDMHSVSF